MQVTLNQNEIEIAIQDYVAEQGIVISGRRVVVSLMAGRGPNGMSATIDISNKDTPVQAAEPTPVDTPSIEGEEDADGDVPLFGH